MMSRLGHYDLEIQADHSYQVTSYYLPTVLIKSVHFGNKMARLLAACNSVSYLIFSTIGIPNVERWGRRKMIMYAAAGQCFCYFMITILLRYQELYLGESGGVKTSSAYEKSTKLGSASVAFFFLYYIFFGIGFQGVPWLYPTEINGLAMRAKGQAVCTASGRSKTNLSQVRRSEQQRTGSSTC